MQSQSKILIRRERLEDFSEIKAVVRDSTV